MWKAGGQERGAELKEEDQGVGWHSLNAARCMLMHSGSFAPRLRLSIHSRITVPLFGSKCVRAATISVNECHAHRVCARYDAQLTTTMVWLRHVLAFGIASQPSGKGLRRRSRRPRVTGKQPQRDVYSSEGKSPQVRRGGGKSDRDRSTPLNAAAGRPHANPFAPCPAWGRRRSLAMPPQRPAFL